MRSPLSRLRPPARAALPLKDALKGLRFTLRQGRRLLEPVTARMPGPLDEVLERVDHLADDAVRVSGRALERLFDLRAQVASVPDLPASHTAAQSDARFAQAAGRALEFALARYGADRLMVSETLLARSYQAVAGQAFQGLEAQAAALMLHMLEHRVIGIVPGTGLGLDATDRVVAAMATFAVMLWLLTDRDADAEGQREEDLLAICCDVAQALHSEILVIGEDAAALAALLAHHAEVI